MLFVTMFISFIFFAGYQPELDLLRDDSPRVAGKLEHVETIHGSRSRKSSTRTKFDYHYSYEVGGATYRGTVYHYTPELTELTVQYAAERPDVSRVDGFYGYGGTSKSLYVPLFFLVPTLYLFLRALLDTIQDVRLAREGVLGDATVVRSPGPDEELAVLHFMTHEGESWQHTPAWNNHQLKNGERKTVVYVPGRPKETTMFEQLDPAMQALLR